MTESEFKNVAEKYAEHYSRSKAEYAEVTIIGGEPTLMPPSFYHEVIPYLRQKFEEAGKSFAISIVTNLLHISSLEKVRDLFDIVVTSYEPQRFSCENDIEGIERKSETWHKNLHNYIKSGNPISISFTTTTDVIEAGTDLLEEFLEKGVTFFQINTMIPEGKVLQNECGVDFYKEHLTTRHSELEKPVRKRKYFSIPNASIIPDYASEAEYFIKLTEWLYDKKMNGVDVDIYPVKSFISGVCYGHLIDDISCCIDKGLNVRPDGNVTGCSAEIGNGNIYSYGNLFEDSIDEIESSEHYKTHLSMASTLTRECRQCDFLNLCYGSCMLRERLWNKQENPESCHGLKPFMSHIKNNLDRLKILLEQ